MRKNLLVEHAADFQPVLDERRGCLVEAVPLAPGAFSCEHTDLVLRPGIRVFVEESVEYRGPDPRMAECLGVAEEGWRELYLPAPTEDLREALEQVERLLGGEPSQLPPLDLDVDAPVAEPMAQQPERALVPKPEEPRPVPPSAPRRRGSFNMPPAIKSFVRDLTALVLKGELGPVIGREKETDSLLVVLGKRERPNAVLVGPPGVGKSAVAYRLATRLAEGAVPSTLSDAHLLELNCGDLIAGASFKGEVEARVKRLVEACSDPRIILFVDEFHNLLEARGDVKVIEILKPALARGGIRVLGACTPKDYRTIEMDGTLARRFEKLMVGEPTGEETVQILEGLQPELERHHGVRLPPGAIQEAVYLSEHFLPNRYQPDKAVTLLDEALSRLRLEKASTQVPERSAADLQVELDRAIDVGDFARARRLHDELTKKETAS